MKRPQVLVIDDEPAFLRSLELVLHDTHDVVLCSRSPDALAMVQQDPSHFDVILCDLSMPDLDGIEFYAAMRELGISNRFVMVTAGAFTARAEEFVRTVSCARIAKPFTFEELTRAIAAVA